MCRDCGSKILSSPVVGDADSKTYICGHCLGINAFSIALVR